MYKYSAVVDRVKDGDTMVLSVDCGFYIKIQMTCRLLGVDAYETRLIRGNTPEEVEKGIEGKKYMKEWLEGKTVIIETVKDEEDKYGRYLVKMMTEEGVSVNDEVVYKGFGKYTK